MIQCIGSLKVIAKLGLYQFLHWISKIDFFSTCKASLHRWPSAGPEALLSVCCPSMALCLRWLAAREQPGNVGQNFLQYYVEK